MRWNICAGVRRWCRQNSHVTCSKKKDGGSLPILYRLITEYSSAQFYLFMWMFWCTPSTLKIAKSSPRQQGKIVCSFRAVILIRNMLPQIKRHLPGSHPQDYEGELISYYIRLQAKKKGPLPPPPHTGILQTYPILKKISSRIF